MAITKYDPCDAEEVGTFVPEADCIEEGSRMIGAFLIKKGFDLELLVVEETEDFVTIDEAITNGDLKVLKGLSGNWAKGTSNKKPGKGFNREQHSTWTWAIPFSHYSVDANLKFWNAVSNRKEWSMAFVFEDFSIWACLDRDGQPIIQDIVADPESTDELGGARQFSGVVNWTAKDLPYNVNAPAVPAFTKSALRQLFY